MPRRATVQEFNPAGLNLDTAPAALPVDVYSNAANMRVSGTGMTRADGETLYDPEALFGPKWGIAFVQDGAPMMLYAGEDGVAVTDGLTHTDVTPVGWLDFVAGEMTGGILNGLVVFNAPNHVPWYYDGSAVLPLPGFLAGKQCRVLAPFNAHLFAGSLVGASIDYEALAWSDLAGPGTVPATWTPTATNQAGDLNLGTGVGPIMAMHGLGTSLMVYRTSGCWAVTYTGRPFIYTARKLSAEVGAATCNSVVEAAGGHAVLAPGDLVMTDGTTMRSIGENRVKRSLFAQMSELGLKRSHVYALPGRNEVVFCLALGRDDACNVAYVWNYNRDKWSVRDLSLTTHTITGIIPNNAPIDTWVTDAGTWAEDDVPWNSPPAGGFKPNAVGCSPTLGLINVDVGDVRLDGTNVNASVERTGLLLGEEPRVRMIHAVYPRIEGTAGDVLQVQVGASLDASSPVTWQAPQDYTLGTSRKVDATVQGRFAAVRVIGAVLAPWSVSGFGVEWSARGQQ